MGVDHLIQSIETAVSMSTPARTTPPAHSTTLHALYDHEMRSTNDTRANGRNTERAIEQAALDLFHQKGFHGTSVRDISSKAGVGIATIFHYEQNKATILDRLLNEIVDRLKSELESALDGIEDPVERLTAAVRELVRVHCEWQRESFVAYSELRSLPPDARRIVLHKRTLVQSMFAEALTQAVAERRADCDPKETARAIVSMIAMIATWYRPDHDPAPGQIADVYVGMALRLAGVEAPARAQVTPGER
ncbi:MAG: hypothetical protein V7607_5699 [Solirubrobacteraceae bacterium]